MNRQSPKSRRLRYLRPRLSIASACLFAAVINLAGCGMDIPDELEPGQKHFISADPTAPAGVGAFDALNAPIADAQDDRGTELDEQAGEDLRLIEEADIVKKAGQYLYVLNAYRGLRIIDLSNPADIKLLGTLAVAGQPQDMYVEPPNAYVIAAKRYSCEDQSQARSLLIVMDVSLPQAPRTLAEFEFDGDVVTSRRVGQVIYLAGYKQPQWFYSLSDAAAAKDDDATAETELNDGFVASINVADPANVYLVDRLDFPGQTSQIHATQDAVFIAGYSWAGETTAVQYVDISDPQGSIVLGDRFEVPGRIISKFCIDAYEGAFRIVTERWRPDGRAVKLFTYDLSDPHNIIGLSELALIKNESLRAVRFDAQRGYVVTFEQVDPLWVLDLSDPTDPSISGHLEAPGFSTHIEPLGDRLVAVGHNDVGDWRPTVLLYDVSDPARPAELDREVIGQQYAHSEANYDEKALKVLPEAELILMPFDYWDQQGDRYVNGLQLVDYSTDRLQQRAWLQHRGTVQRSGVEDAWLWLLSQLALRTADISDRDDPRVLDEVELAYYVADVEVISDQYALLAVNDEAYGWNSGQSGRLWLVPADQPDSYPPLAQLELPRGGARILKGRNVAYVVGPAGHYGEETFVTAVDLQKLPQLQVLAENRFDIRLGGGCDWWPVQRMARGGGWAMAAMAADMMIWPAIRPGADDSSAMLVKDDLVVLIGNDDYWYWWSWDGQVTQVATILLADGELQVADSVEVQGLASQFFVADGQLCYTTWQPLLRVLDLTNPVARYYLARFDIAATGKLTALDPVNVPGVVQAKDGPQVYTADPVWRDGDIGYRLCALELTDDGAELLGSYTLQDGWIERVKVISGLACVIAQQDTWSGPQLLQEDATGPSFALKVIDLRDPQQIGLIHESQYCGWGEFVGASSDAIAFIQTGGLELRLVQLPLDEQELQILGPWSLPGYPVSTVDITDDAVYAPIGLAGVAVADKP